MHDVIVVGAGPAGLAAAIAAGRAGLTCLLIEKGALVNSILNFPRNIENGRLHGEAIVRSILERRRA